MVWKDNTFLFIRHYERLDDRWIEAAAEFNYNLHTFLLVDEPKAVATSEYSSHDGMKSIIDRLYMRFEDSKKKIGSEQVYHQFALINCTEFQGKYVADYVHGFYESQLDMNKEKGLL